MVNKSLFVMDPNDRIFEEIKNISIKSIFFSYPSFRPEFADKIKSISKEIKVYVEVSVFAGTDLVKKFPDAKPVDSDGNVLQKDWYAGVCPTHAGVRDEAKNKIKMLMDMNIDGIWLNYIRYPTKWEEKDPDLTDTCYCDRCLKKFSEYIDEPIEGETYEDKFLLIDGAYYFEWLDFKTDQITSFVKEVRDMLDNSGKDIKLGAFIVPWKDDEYGQAMKRIIAQDLTKMLDQLDVFSPMLYHKMVGKTVEWIKEMVAYYWETGKPFIPLIQTEDKPEKLSDEEFSGSLKNAIKSPSLGVCAFFIDDLISKPSKFKILKDFYQKD